MFELEKIIRPRILNLKPYSSARDEFSGKDAVFLDANELPLGNLNRYPDPYQSELKKKLAEIKGVQAEQIFIGNGSDEIIDLAFRIFCEPNLDQALTFSPTYGMYEVCADLNGVELIQIPLEADFQIPTQNLRSILANTSLKLFFLCSPNNPTGNLLRRDDIVFVLDNFNGIVIIDEAYIDFAEDVSWIESLSLYPNLIISQTFSKAWGLAGARVGVAYGSPEIMALFNKVKYPYNVSDLNQRAALIALDNYAGYNANLIFLKTEKLKLEEALQELPIVEKIYPSDANFLLVKVNDADGIYETLVRQKIIIRNRHKQIPNCVRITVGTAEENTLLIKTLKNIR